MNIAIFGLGYVGCVSAACFSREGHHVYGVDVKSEKVATINEGNSPIIEPGLSELLARGVSERLIGATLDGEKAISEAEVLMICVGTPSRRNGALDLQYVLKVCEDIAKHLKNNREYKTVAIRSTMLPGYAVEKLIPLMEEVSGKKAGRDFGFCVNPEFLREGSAIYDFDNPPFTIIGQLDQACGDQLATLYEHLDAPIYRVSLGVGEIIKYASNAFHALKVTFANEIGNLCKANGVDSHEVMRIFVEDTKLNVSSAYLKPGFAFGGSCLPKDLRAILFAARKNDLRLPVLDAILLSNELRIQEVVELLLDQNSRKIGIIGLSFKTNTDDLRESPAIELTERLIGKGFNLAIYDREVSLSNLIGSNRAFIEEAIPHIGSLIKPTIQEAVQNSDIVVVTKKLTDSEFENLLVSLTKDHLLVDLVRLDDRNIPDFEGQYYGISW